MRSVAAQLLIPAQHLYSLLQGSRGFRLASSAQSVFSMRAAHKGAN
ncbi:hypothetical protein SEEN185_19726 [Salmonella enterica subsp. enterica serovar Newport str. CVM 35185]|nr:hypothetical protein SEEN185_19726 [Salmonella enterica subsp. enterica serovar Newport str. CVM 35185]